MLVGCSSKLIKQSKKHHMANSTKDTPLPKDYVKLPGSERHPSKGSKLIGPADESEMFKITVVLRRRTDGKPIPDFDYYSKNPPGKRRVVSPEEFAENYGADPREMKNIVQFAEKAGLKVLETNAGRRTIVAEGTVAEMSKAFALSLGRYEYTLSRGTKGARLTYSSSYRGRDGFINVPKDLAPTIVGVFGLDNRKIGQHSGLPGDPYTTDPISIQQVSQLYNFPNPGVSINSQTIGIIAPTGGLGGYLTSDLNLYFNSIGSAYPNLFPVSVDGFHNGTMEIATAAATNAGSDIMTFSSTAGQGFFINSFGQLTIGVNTYYFRITAISSSTTITVIVYDFATQTWVNQFPVVVPSGTSVFWNLDQETTQDICISASAATGANIAVYFSDDTQAGWVDLISRVIQPNAADFPAGVNPPSVLSASWSIAPGDDPDGMTYADNYWGTGITLSGLTAMDLAFQDAAINGITVCIASGDNGSAVPIGDAFAHVEPPASDPWVLAVGGTTIGKSQPSASGSPAVWVEYVWNDTFFGNETGASGGGVSDYFPLPSYQNGAGVPNSVNLTIKPGSSFNATGRGVPDVAGNASPNSGYLIWVGGQQAAANGTSASTPLWAALVGVINSNLGYNIGFINSILYELGPGVFNFVNPLWPDPAYPQLAGCPPNNSLHGIQGYPAKSGWDACTGLGSPNGNAILTAFRGLANPDVYILGGYQSPSILLTDPSTNPPNQPVPIGGLPGGRWDTLLKPSTAYGFAAVVHNDSPAAVNNVEVRFWGIPGGLAIDGYLIGVPQLVTIPPYSSVTVNASAPFVSAPAGQHLCAVVSLFNATTGCLVQAANALEIPNPGQDGSHGCSAWRNTDSMTALPGGNFKFPLSFGKIVERLARPILVSIQPIHIPHNWEQLARVTQLEDVLKYIGVDNNFPLYLLPQINRSFPTIHLKTDLSISEGGKTERKESSHWEIYPGGKDEQTTFEIAGEIPKSARAGDIVLVKISAQYPGATKANARQVEFYEFIHIVKEKR
jgi:hypothetical protein